MAAKDIQIRPMTTEDYEEVFNMWQSISGFGIRSWDDSKEGIERFIARNPGLSVVALHEGRIIGGILCGHDGRRGCLYHVCVRQEYRMLGIGQDMVVCCKEALRKEGINKINLIAFKSNEIGNKFWQKLNWKHREDCNYYEENLNPENVTNFVP
ncbi:MAG: GNAT family N-acetyltransferase [Lachnospiraceae bacterium]|nr:GNAT family N-acetyltransferase [Lachnospiraceae bacterium]